MNNVSNRNPHSKIFSTLGRDLVVRRHSRNLPKIQEKSDYRPNTFLREVSGKKSLVDFNGA